MPARNRQPVMMGNEARVHHESCAQPTSANITAAAMGFDVDWHVSNIQTEEQTEMFHGFVGEKERKTLDPNDRDARNRRAAEEAAHTCVDQMRQYKEVRMNAQGNEFIVADKFRTVLKAIKEFHARCDTIRTSMGDIRLGAGESILHLACLYRTYDVAKLILEIEPSMVADVFNSLKYQGETILHMLAAHGGGPAVLDMLRFVKELCLQRDPAWLFPARTSKLGQTAFLEVYKREIRESGAEGGGSWGLEREAKQAAGQLFKASLEGHGIDSLRVLSWKHQWDKERRLREEAQGKGKGGRAVEREDNGSSGSLSSSSSSLPDPTLFAAIHMGGLGRGNKAGSQAAQDVEHEQEGQEDGSRPLGPEWCQLWLREAWRRLVNAKATGTFFQAPPIGTCFYGSTALSIASVLGRTDVMRFFLIEAGWWQGLPVDSIPVRPDPLSTPTAAKARGTHGEEEKRRSRPTIPIPGHTAMFLTYSDYMRLYGGVGKEGKLTQPMELCVNWDPTTTSRIDTRDPLGNTCAHMAVYHSDDPGAFSELAELYSLGYGRHSTGDEYGRMPALWARHLVSAHRAEQDDQGSEESTVFSFWPEVAPQSSARPFSAETLRHLPGWGRGIDVPVTFLQGKGQAVPREEQEGEGLQGVPGLSVLGKRSSLSRFPRDLSPAAVEDMYTLSAGPFLDALAQAVLAEMRTDLEKTAEEIVEKVEKENKRRTLEFKVAQRMSIALPPDPSIAQRPLNLSAVAREIQEEARDRMDAPEVPAVLGRSQVRRNGGPVLDMSHAGRGSSAAAGARTAGTAGAPLHPQVALAAFRMGQAMGMQGVMHANPLHDLSMAAGVGIVPVTPSVRPQDSNINMQQALHVRFQMLLTAGQANQAHFAQLDQSQPVFVQGKRFSMKFRQPSDARWQSARAECVAFLLALCSQDGKVKEYLRTEAAATRELRALTSELSACLSSAEPLPHCRPASVLHEERYVAQQRLETAREQRQERLRWLLQQEELSKTGQAAIVALQRNIADVLSQLRSLFESLYADRIARRVEAAEGEWIAEEETPKIQDLMLWTEEEWARGEPQVAALHVYCTVYTQALQKQHAASARSGERCVLHDLVNFDGLTPITLAAQLSKKAVFEYMVKNISRFTWEWGGVTATCFPLDQLDDIGHLADDNTAIAEHIQGSSFRREPDHGACFCRPRPRFRPLLFSRVPDRSPAHSLPQALLVSLLRWAKWTPDDVLSTLLAPLLLLRWCCRQPPSCLRRSVPSVRRPRYPTAMEMVVSLGLWQMLEPAAEAAARATREGGTAGKALSELEEDRLERKKTVKMLQQILRHVQRPGRPRATCASSALGPAGGAVAPTSRAGGTEAAHSRARLRKEASGAMSVDSPAGFDPAPAFPPSSAFPSPENTCSRGAAPKAGAGATGGGPPSSSPLHSSHSASHTHHTGAAGGGIHDLDASDDVEEDGNETFLLQLAQRKWDRVYSVLFYRLQMQRFCLVLLVWVTAIARAGTPNNHVPSLLCNAPGMREEYASHATNASSALAPHHIWDYRHLIVPPSQEEEGVGLACVVGWYTVPTMCLGALWMLIYTLYMYEKRSGLLAWMVLGGGWLEALRACFGCVLCAHRQRRAHLEEEAVEGGSGRERAVIPPVLRDTERWSRGRAAFLASHTSSFGLFYTITLFLALLSSVVATMIDMAQGWPSANIAYALAGMSGTAHMIYFLLGSASTGPLLVMLGSVLVGEFWRWLWLFGPSILVFAFGLFALDAEPMGAHTSSFPFVSYMWRALDLSLQPESAWNIAHGSEGEEGAARLYGRRAANSTAGTVFYMAIYLGIVFISFVALLSLLVALMSHAFEEHMSTPKARWRIERARACMLLETYLSAWDRLSLPMQHRYFIWLPHDKKGDVTMNLAAVPAPDLHALASPPTPTGTKQPTSAWKQMLRKMLGQKQAADAPQKALRPYFFSTTSAITRGHGD